MLRALEGRPRAAGLLSWLRLVRVFQRVDRLSTEALRTHGISSAQLDVLARVGSSEGISQQRLADALLVTKGNISQLLGKMEADGLVSRRQDGRSNCLSLTEQGRALYETVVPEQEALVAETLAPLTLDEQRELLRLLRKLDQGIDG